MITFLPDFAAATVRPSPNFGERRGFARPDMLVLHYTGMVSGQAAEDWLCDPRSEVSCHYVVHEDGRVVQLVPETSRAWHAGKSSWHGETDINSHSVGIEIVNPGHSFGYPPFPRRQITAVIALCRDIIARNAIPAARVLGHSDVAPGRKVDPGEKFPWGRLSRAGIGLWRPPSRRVTGPTLQRGDHGAPVAALQASLVHFGYGLEVTGTYDERTRTVVSAFQLHFRPDRADGVADPATRATLRKLSTAATSVLA